MSVSKSNPVLITHRCPNDQCRGLIHTQVDQADHLEKQCPTCEEPVDMDIDSALLSQRMLNRCCCCSGREFFIRKDFPQKLGLAGVIIAALIATFFYYLEHVLATYATLASLVLIDAVIFLFVGRATVCYRCRAEFRGVAYNTQHKNYDLATAEKYRRKIPTSSGPSS